MIFLGIDTSNYTTSVCAVSDSSVTSRRRILDVRSGERGIRQSKGVFQHMKSFPELLESLSEEVDMRSAAAVGVSTRPRSAEGSYMPVFLAGQGYARTIAAALGVPVFEYSHQDGHIMAGVCSCGCYELLEGAFISVHLSGGTTEILRTQYNGHGFDVQIIGGSRDISAGQFIDRVGVALGLDFPAGVHMERLADKTSGRVSLPVKTDGAWMNFSGVETKAQGLVGSADNAALARGVIFEIRRALMRTITAAMKETDIDRVLVVGGVASNAMIREGLCSLPGAVCFASREFSTDNAMGIAELVRYEYGSKNRDGISDQRLCEEDTRS